MREIFGLDYYGKRNITSHCDICGSCRKLTTLSTYTTEKFLHLKQFPLIPLGRKQIVAECPFCGHRITTSNRKYRKKRKEDLAVMMDGFSSESDHLYAALNGLQTLMVYNEKSWFMDVMNSYGRRFSTHMALQLLIAQGLCRFGHYAEAETYCRKAIVLGAGPNAEELLALCQSIGEKTDTSRMEALSARPESMLRPYAFVIAFTASLFIAIVTSGVSSILNHTAWLANGSSTPYSVEIDGSQYRLNPYGVKRIKLHLGEHKMRTRGLPGHETPVLFSYKTSLIKQKFGHHSLVVNPDAMAVMVIETLVGEQTTNSYRFGETINAMAGIDYPFASFPAWAGSKRSGQSRLFLHVPTNDLEIVELLRTHGNPADAGEYARRALIVEPSGPEVGELLKIATSSLSTARAMAFLQGGTAATPPLLEWHRFYQDFVEIHPTGHDLQTEYAMRCEAHPDVSENYYLLGRVTQNRSSAKLLFEKSEKDAGCGGLGYYAIAYDLLCSGEFAAALPYSEKAQARAPGNPAFQELSTQIYLALQQYDPLLQQSRAAFAADPHNGGKAAELIRYLTLMGEHQQAISIAEKFQPANGDDSITWGDYFEAVRFHAVGNATDYIASLMDSGVKDTNLQRFLHTGEIEMAQNIIDKNEKATCAEHLLLYCAAQYHGLPEIAGLQQAKVVADTESSIRFSRAAADMLSADTAPAVEQLIDLRVWPSEKAVLCAALGFRFPEQREAFFNLARKFNYTPGYPQLVLKKWTRPPRKSP